MIQGLFKIVVKHRGRGAQVRQLSQSILVLLALCLVGQYLQRDLLQLFLFLLLDLFLLDIMHFLAAGKTLVVV